MRCGAAVAVALGWVALAAGVGRSQSIVFDGTLGSAETLQGPVYEIEQGLGATAGNNLFHSFERFDLATGEEARFLTNGDIRNVLTRVTGGVGSEIDGLLSIQGSDANLFMMNPAGLVFGPNAQLDIRGSFVGTAASEIRFGDGGRFSAVEPDEGTALLTVDPTAFVFGARPGAIVSRSAAPAGTNPLRGELYGLRVDQGQSLILLGGDVEIDGGGTVSGGLNVPGGRIELGGLAEAGEVSLAIEGAAFVLAFPETGVRGDVALLDDARVSTRSNGGGDIVVNARNLLALDGGRLVIGTEGGDRPGNLTLNAKNINLSGVSFRQAISSGLYTEMLGDSAETQGGDIQVNSQTLRLDSGAKIESYTSANAKGGDIKIDSEMLVESFGNNTRVKSTVDELGLGNGGNIQITTDTLNTNNGSQVNSSSFGFGNAGNIMVKASEINIFDGVPFGDQGISFSGIFTFTLPNSKGNSGNIFLTSDSLRLINLSTIDSSSSGQGKAGSISLKIQNLIEIDQSSNIVSSAFGDTSSDSGNILIDTNKITVSGGSYVTANSFSAGKSGNIRINADNLKLSSTESDAIRSDISAGSSRGGINGLIDLNISDQIYLDRGSISIPSSGETELLHSRLDSREDAGSININAGSLILKNNSELLSSSFNQADSGDINIEVDSTIGLDSGSYIRSTVASFEQPFGNAVGGDINIQSRFLSLSESDINAGTLNQGNSGAIRINVYNAINLDQQSVISALSTGKIAGTAGDIDIDTNELTLSRGSRILSGTEGVSDAGDITVKVDNLIMKGAFAIGENITFSGNISSDSGGEGNAGNIKINAQESISIEDGIISTVLTSNSQNRDSLEPNKAGDISLSSSKINLLDNTKILTFVGEVPEGVAGKINISAAEGLRIINGAVSSFNSSNGSSSESVAGNINLSSTSFLISEGGSITSTTDTQGDAGFIIIDVKENALVQGEIESNTTSSIGNGGEIRFRARNLTVGKNGLLFPATSSSGNAGDIILDISERTVFKDGGLAVSNTSGSGSAGDIFIDTNQLEIKGRSANNVPSQLLSNANATATGQAGNVSISARDVRFSDGGQVSASSFSEQGTSGNNLFLDADTLTLDQGFILTQASSGTDSGNITLDLKTAAILKNNSGISTSAGFLEAGGDGGNITLTAPFLIGLPGQNSDIIANAFQGSGGNVTINANAILNFDLQNEPNIDRLRANTTNDISASSQLGSSGILNLTGLNADLSRGTTELPTDLTDRTSQIDRSCSPATTSANSFTASGRSGIPFSPAELPQLTNQRPTWLSLPKPTESAATADAAMPPAIATPQPATLNEATHWSKNTKGQVQLISLSHHRPITPHTTPCLQAATPAAAESVD